MLRHLLILFFIFPLFSPQCFSQNIENNSKLREIIRQYGQAEVIIPYSDRISADILSQNVSIVSVINNSIYIKLSPLTAEWFIQQKFNYLIVERIENKGVISAQNLIKALDWETYPTYSQYDSIMHSFSNTYPDLCHLDTIGTSVNGKLVLAIKISDNAAIEEGEPETFYSSTIHGDETGGFVLMLRLIDYLLKNYNLNSRVKNLVDNMEIWINPLANPDGTYNSGNTIISPTRFNANGYDLNRNFPDPAKPYSDNYVMQKETHDMVKFMREHKFVISANFHSGVEVVNYPWDKWFSKFHADDSWFYSISRAYADTAHAYSGPAYMNYLDNGVTRGADWYIINGGRQDFITWELQGREVTIELDDQYVTPAAQLPLLWMYNWHSLIGYLENALYGIHGLVRNKSTEEPVPAKVYIAGHDKDNSHVYSDTLSGSFIRLIEPGQWSLTFTANGYFDTTISNIDVFPEQRTDIIVDMRAVTNHIGKTFSKAVLLYPNPAENVIGVELPDEITGNVNVRIINQLGMLLTDYTTETFHGNPLTIDVSWLPAGTYFIFFKNIFTGFSSHGRFVVIK